MAEAIRIASKTSIAAPWMMITPATIQLRTRSSAPTTRQALRSVRTPVTQETVDARRMKRTANKRLPCPKLEPMRRMCVAHNPAGSHNPCRFWTVQATNTIERRPSAVATSSGRPWDVATYEIAKNLAIHHAKILLFLT